MGRMPYLCAMIKRDVAQYIEKENLLLLQDKVLVALSGGADSVALLRILLSLGYTCEAAHCNFHLRGNESDRDEAFVRRLCLTLGVTLHTTHFQTVVYAREKRISIEMAARELRYQWFDDLAREHRFTAIAVAHHQDDSIETLLLNLIRGTGINGLLGIRPRNGNIVRPLLATDRQTITDYLKAIGQDYVTDSTNLEDEYTRNKIRLKLLPLMEEINPAIRKKLFQTTNHLNEVSKIYHQYIISTRARVENEQGIHIDTLLSEPSPHALLFEMLHPLGFNTSQIADIMRALSGQPGKQFISSQGVRAIKDRDMLLISRPASGENQPPFELTFDEQPYDDSYIIPREKHIACFDADKLQGVFNLRKCRTGDTFIPFGMNGRKKISDFLTDLKLTIEQKDNQWLLCSGESIVWVVGLRTDNRFRVDTATKRIVKVIMSSDPVTK